MTANIQNDIRIPSNAKKDALDAIYEIEDKG